MSGIVTPASGGAAVSVSDQTPVEQSVSFETHNRLLAQRKADQARAEAAEAERDRLKAAAEAAESARLAERQEYKTLYETEKKKREEADAAAAKLTLTQTTAAKRSALAAQIGGVKKDEFLNFADLSKIKVSADGAVDMDTVKEVANKFREQYPELLVTKATGNVPADAPRDASAPITKPLDKMSPAELRALYIAKHPAAK